MKKSTVLVLGTNHLDTPDNGDIFMPKTEGIFSEKRQREINEVVQMLKKFRPTKVALEVVKERQDRLNEEYNAFRGGNFTLTANERHQFGFKLAKEMNHKKLFAVDWNGQVEGVPNLGEWAKETGSRIFDEILVKEEKRSSEIENYFNNHSIREFLLWLNNSENIKSSQETYMQIALIGDPHTPAGAMWTAQYWYYRNMVIYKRIVELAQSGQERIFVLYGAGHLHLLMQFLQESGVFNVEIAEEYLEV
ncbi:DUF5694 domain-containing protein [Bacillus sp. SCS-153A]|uniref:DUF5694 domain-containing protein n=1 Tax=Rossellomorea sedimentorum TaxID=3115294 RepID=UPI00390582CF